MNFEVKRADGEDKDFQDLMKLLDEDLWKRYSDLQKNYAGLNATNKSFLVVIGYEEEKAVSCGALKQIDESTLELKRVFTKEEFRGKGYSRKVLYELESSLSTCSTHWVS